MSIESNPESYGIPTETVTRQLPSATPRYSSEVQLAMQKVFGMAIETPSEVADVFVNFSPHTDQIYTSVFKGGWTDRRPDWSEWTDDTDMTGLPQRLGAYLNSLQNPQPHPHDECLATRADDKAFVRP